jgi:hypothetical protein
VKNSSKGFPQVFLMYLVLYCSLIMWEILMLFSDGICDARLDVLNLMNEV